MRDTAELGAVTKHAAENYLPQVSTKTLSPNMPSDPSRYGYPVPAYLEAHTLLLLLPQDGNKCSGFCTASKVHVPACCGGTPLAVSCHLHGTDLQHPHWRAASFTSSRRVLFYLAELCQQSACP